MYNLSQLPLTVKSDYSKSQEVPRMWIGKGGYKPFRSVNIKDYLYSFENARRINFGVVGTLVDSFNRFHSYNIRCKIKLNHTI